ncbi:MAG: hypothetical protein IPL32_03670 [Chloracidobacterium sp.]|nr:hypothetical protein [Chloracidobacterium sp.]
MEYEVPYDKMDSNIVELVKALNSFDGIYTIDSCGGHQNNKHYQLPAGSWEVSFKLRPARQYSPSVNAWLTLELLVYTFCKCYSPDKGHVRITTFSPSPQHNFSGPGNSISFALEGTDADPDDVALYLHALKEEYFD